MATKVILPVLGQTMEEGTITKWLKKEGEQVSKGEPLVEVMTDKVNMEVEAPVSGVLRKILAQEDDTVPVMDMIAIIGTADEPIEGLLAGGNGSAGATEAAAAEISQPEPEAAPVLQMEVPASSPSRVFISPRARRLAYEHSITIESMVGQGTGPGGRIVERDVRAYIDGMSHTAVFNEEMVMATPLAARIAADQGIDLSSVSGSGRQGRITRDDVLQAVAPAPAAGAPQARTIPFTGMRKMVADAVAKSAQTAPHVTLTSEVDMTAAVELRGQVVAEFEKKYGTRLTYTDLIVKAAATALLEHPIVNASLQGNEIRIPAEVNIGLAVALDGGLVVPVIRNADRKFVPQIIIEARQLADKARSGGLSGAELSGGTFTITNLGAFGIDVFNPIITPGQSAILGVCRIAEKPVVYGGQLCVRSMMNLCLSFDHRVMDGAPAAQFLRRVKELLESPYQLLI